MALFDCCQQNAKQSPVIVGHGILISKNEPPATYPFEIIWNADKIKEYKAFLRLTLPEE